jgi:hypothetical protein
MFETEFSESVDIRFDKDEALVLFEMVSEFRDGSSLPIADDAERRVVWNLACLIERVLAEPFRSDYAEVLAEAKRRLQDLS